MRLSVGNLGPEPLPFGLGFHPWLVRTPGTLLQAKAKWFGLENSDHLPDGEAPVASRVEWDFAAPRALPGDWINNAFLGWDGRATIVWSDRELALEVEADGPLSTYIVYSPSAKAHQASPRTSRATSGWRSCNSPWPRRAVRLPTFPPQRASSDG
jgi:aldose 1-epimerase